MDVRIEETVEDVRGETVRARGMDGRQGFRFDLAFEESSYFGIEQGFADLVVAEQVRDGD